MKLPLHRCTAGTVAVATALVLPLLLGFGSLGIEVGHWYLMQRQMQGAADAAAISAAAQYIQDRVADKTTSTAYQTTGQSYASLNGFTIPLANTCLITASGDNCGAIRALDARQLPTCTDAAPCMAVEITQDTFQWVSTNASLEPNGLEATKPIPTPTLVARSVVSMNIVVTTTVQGNSCILALANDRNAVQVRGNGNINARCGVLIDGGRDQNQGHHQRRTRLVHAAEQTGESQDQTDKNDRGDQVSDDTETEKRLVSQDVVGGRSGVPTHEQSAGNIDEAEGRGDYH